MSRGKAPNRSKWRKRETENHRNHRGRMDQLRPVVFSRAAYTCEAGRGFSPDCSTGWNWWLEAHHRLPTGDHGPDTLENLVALCNFCHYAVHHRTPAKARDWGLLLSSYQGSPTEAWEHPAAA